MITQPTPERVLIGPRLLTVSRTVLDRVTTLALLYRLDSDRRWAARAREELMAAAAFSDWNPPHFLDVAEMSYAFAIGYDWLYDALSADDRATIRRALVEKGLQPAAQEYASRAFWTRANHNWNLVCNGAMAVAALAIGDEEPGIAGTVLAQALASLPIASATYAPDGAWPEGAAYWEYGTLYLVSVLASLTSALGTDFGLSEAAGLATTGRFRLHLTGPSGLFFNFADATARAGDAPMLFWLARRYDDPVLAVAARDAATGRSSARDLLWYDARGVPTDFAAVPLDARYQATQLAFFRSAWNDKDALYVGFKGGDNTANHAHLDLGTFVLDALGQRWAVDLGPDDYDLPGYFGPERWTYERLKTSGQNTLLLDGANQDPKATAPLTAYRSSVDSAFAIADLTAAYAESGATRVNRGITLRDNRTRVLIQDEVETTKPVELTWTMHTQADVELQGDRALLSQGGAVLEARLLGPAGAT
ncbi:MAG TPA: heparinase II/III family protein, partial [Candidatus Dormibacteraeota bacterium]